MWRGCCDELSCLPFSTLLCYSGGYSGMGRGEPETGTGLFSQPRSSSLGVQEDSKIEPRAFGASAMDCILDGIPRRYLVTGSSLKSLRDGAMYHSKLRTEPTTPHPYDEHHSLAPKVLYISQLRARGGLEYFCVRKTTCSTKDGRTISSTGLLYEFPNENLCALRGRARLNGQAVTLGSTSK